MDHLLCVLILGLSCELPQKYGVSLGWAVWGSGWASCPSTMHHTLWFGFHSGRHLCTIWSKQCGVAVPISLRALLPGFVLAEGYLSAICCPQVLWLRKGHPHFGH